MTNNYFAIERANKCADNVYIKNEDGTTACEDVMAMSYEQIKSYEKLDEFVTGMMDAANTYFDESDNLTLITLVGEDDVFIWSIIIGPGDNDDELKYAFVDWKKSDKSYRYEKD